MNNSRNIILIVLVFLSIQSYAQEFFLGVDLSYVNELEDNGAVYSDANGTEQDPYEIFADKGSNLVRLRLWHNPQWTNYSNLADVIKSIEKAKANGLKVLLDFHYSDFWADPSRQWCPEAWNNINSDVVMGDSVYNYTYKTLKALADKSLLPEYVQIGNEINGNILLTRNDENIDGHSPNMQPINWDRQVALLHKGIDAVKQINQELSSNIKTVIHVAQPENAVWWFNDAVSNGLEGFDIIGLSYYPEWSELGIHEVGAHIKDFKTKYEKDVMIVEFGYPWTSDGNDNANNVLGSSSKRVVYGNQLSNQVQKDILIELTYLVKENGGIGLIYWEPAWVSSEAETYWGKGSHYENATLFDFNNLLNIGADFLDYDYNIKPTALLDQTVSFKVNMEGQDTENGVYVTGSFTGYNWEFIPMDLLEDNWYSYTTAIPGRSAGAYIFYNNNEWNDNYRETVPASCASMWGTHRSYVVQGKTVDNSYYWGSCDYVSTSEVSNKNTVFLYPSPASDFIFIEGATANSNIEVFNILGEKQHCPIQGDNSLCVSELTTGHYFVVFRTKNDHCVKRFIKN